MIQLALILLGIIIFFVGCEYETGFIAFIGGSLIVLSLGSFLLNNISNQSNNPKHIDLPEEWDQISHKSNKPDTLIGYIRNDTLYIGFKH